MTSVKDLSDKGIKVPAGWNDMAPDEQDAWASQALAGVPQTGYGPAVNDAQRTAAFESNWNTSHGGETHWDGTGWSTAPRPAPGTHPSTPSAAPSTSTPAPPPKPAAPPPSAPSSPSSGVTLDPLVNEGWYGNRGTSSSQAAPAPTPSAPRPSAPNNGVTLDPLVNEGWYGSRGQSASSASSAAPDAPASSPKSDQPSAPEDWGTRWQRAQQSVSDGSAGRGADAVISGSGLASYGGGGSTSAGAAPSAAPPAALVDVFRQIQEPSTSGTDTALVIDLWCLLDGGGVTITTGTVKAYMRVKFPCKLIGATVLADTSGDVTLDIQKTDYATFPVFTSIVAATPPTISADVKTEDTNLTDWTVLLSRGDILRIDVTTCSAAMLVLLDLAARRTDASDKTTQ